MPLAEIHQSKWGNNLCHIHSCGKGAISWDGDGTQPVRQHCERFTSVSPAFRPACEPCNLAVTCIHAHNKCFPLHGLCQSIMTKHLVELLKEPNLQLHSLFDRLQELVAKDSRKEYEKNNEDKQMIVNFDQHGGPELSYVFRRETFASVPS